MPATALLELPRAATGGPVLLGRVLDSDAGSFRMPSRPLPKCWTGNETFAEDLVFELRKRLGVDGTAP